MNDPSKHLLIAPFFSCLLLGIQGVDAATPSAEGVAFFEKKIRPALIKYCYECHSEESGKTRGGLLLDTREGMLQGGDNGNVLAGDPYTKSLFWEAISWADMDMEMPPKKQMPAEVIQSFRSWLQMGAPDPRNRQKIVLKSKVDLESGRKHWAFKSLTATPGATIDSLVSARLTSASLTPVGPADASTLLRRLSFDLIGLPPAPEELATFRAAWQRNSKAAIIAKVDELLKRPQFGERWGRHWLDVARYAESTGKDVNVTYPHAWRYRDYVFDAFNADKPYDEFIREQIAGDMLKIKSDAEWQEHLIATGFLAMGTKGLNERNPRQSQMDVVDEQIDIMSQAVLGLTVSCARCHDHKNDPIPMTDYYALAGIFLSTKTYYGTIPSAQNRRSTGLIQLPLADPMQAKKQLSPTDIQRLKDQHRQLIQSRRTARNNEKTSQSQLANIRRRIAETEATLAALNENGIPATQAMGVLETKKPIEANALVRGDVEKPAQKVPRGFLQVLPAGGPATIQRGESGRRELADWLTSRSNPLTARVMVNRIWLQLFGEGLVASPNNWGLTGHKPTHPKLLDHLALRFMAQDWSVKKLIRSIVLSDTYQRSSQINPANYQVDPDNKLLWRANPRPLDAEALRDSILTAGGGLDLKRPYGSQVSQVGDKRVGGSFNQGQMSTEVRYRSVYLPILRDDLPEALGLFDFADPNASNPKRESTNVPSQALYLMNSKWVLTEAAAMAKDLVKRFPDRESRIKEAFLRIYSRPPDAVDLAAANGFFSRFKPVDQKVSNPEPFRRPQGRFQRRPNQGQRPQGQFRRPGQGQRPGRMDRAGGGRGGPQQTPTIPAMTAEEQSLAVFCQGLMASAEFRLLN